MVETQRTLSNWARDSGCRLAVLFGSAADPAVSAPRDVDVALEFEALPDPERRLDLIGELQEVVHPRSADVVFLHRDTSPVLRFEIFRGGRALFESEPDLFVKGAVRALALYEDALPFRRALRKSLRGASAVMTRDVLARKLRRLHSYLTHLEHHAGRSGDDIAGDPFEVERLLELVVQVPVDILSHELAARGIVPESYRDTFVQGGRTGLLPESLANTLALSAGLRNVLVHAYEEIDYELVAMSISRALEDLARFVEIYSARLETPTDEDATR